MHTMADGIFYKNYLLYYVNILHRIDHDLVVHSNKVDCTKSIMNMKCKNTYSLLYGSVVNPYYDMRIVKSFIINKVLYMTISLPLKHMKAPVMSIYSLHSYYMPTNMTDYKKPRSTKTKLQISHTYLLLIDDQFALLDDNMDRNTIQYDHIYVQPTPIVLFRRADRNCYVNIIEHAKASIITSRCIFSHYQNISVHATLVTTNDFFFLLNIKEELRVTCGKYIRETTKSTYSKS